MCLEKEAVTLDSEGITASPLKHAGAGHGRLGLWGYLYGGPEALYTGKSDSDCFCGLLLWDCHLETVSMSLSLWVCDWEAIFGKLFPK